MYRWISIASGSPIVHDFPDLETLFLGHGPIFRWATDGYVVFSANLLALVMPTTLIPGGKARYAVRQLTQQEIDDPETHFGNIMM